MICPLETEEFLFFKKNHGENFANYIFYNLSSNDDNGISYKEIEYVDVDSITSKIVLNKLIINGVGSFLVEDGVINFKGYNFPGDISSTPSIVRLINYELYEDRKSELNLPNLTTKKISKLEGIADVKKLESSVESIPFQRNIRGGETNPIKLPKLTNEEQSKYSVSLINDQGEHVRFLKPDEQTELVQSSTAYVLTLLLKGGNLTKKQDLNHIEPSELDNAFKELKNYFYDEYEKATDETLEDYLDMLVESTSNLNPFIREQLTDLGFSFNEKKDDDDKKDDLKDIKNNIDQNNENEQEQDGEYERYTLDQESSQEDSRDKLSRQIKLFLSLIPDVRYDGKTITPLRTNTNLTKPFGMEDLYNKVLMYFEDRPTITYEEIQQELLKEENKKYNPVLVHLAKELEMADDQMKVDFTTFVRMINQKQVLVLYSYEPDGSIFAFSDVSNSSMIKKRLLHEWKQNQIYNGKSLVRSEEGQYSLNPKFVENFTSDFEKINQLVNTSNKDLQVTLYKSLFNVQANKQNIDATINKRIEHFIFGDNGLFDSLGVVLSPETIQHIKEKGIGKQKGGLQGQFKLSEEGASLGYVASVYNVLKKGSEFNNATNNPLDENDINKILDIEKLYTRNLSTQNHIRVDGKRVWSYTKPFYEKVNLLELQRLDSKKQELDNSLFGSKSWLNYLTKTNRISTLDIKPFEGLKNKEEKEGNVRKGLSKREQLFAGFKLWYNEDKASAHIFSLTKSDKTGSLLYTDVPKLSSSTFENGFIDKDFETNKLLEDVYNAEIERISLWADVQSDPQKVKLLPDAFIKGGDMFYYFHHLNPEITKTLLKGKFAKLYEKYDEQPSKNPKLEQLRKVTNAKVLTAIPYKKIKKIIENQIQESVNRDAQKFLKAGLNENYFGDLNNVKNYSFQSWLWNIGISMAYNGDPSLFYKGKDGTSLLTKLRVTYEQYSKRNAKDVAPSTRYAWPEQKYRSIVIKQTNIDLDYLKEYFPKDGEDKDGKKINVGEYSDMETADAIQYCHVKRFIDIQYGKGKLSKQRYQLLKGVIKNGEDYRFSAEQLNWLEWAAEKPVEVNLRTSLKTSSGKNFETIDYVKSSLIPLVPQLYAGTELDKLRKYMELNNIDQTYLSTAGKSGNFAGTAKGFDGDGNFILDQELKKSNILIENYTKELDSNGFGIQQELPYKRTKEKINLITQMEKLIDDTIGRYQNKVFNYKGQLYTGLEMANIKDDLWREYYGISIPNYYDSVGYDPLTKQWNVDKLKDFLSETSGLTKNELESLKIENGEFVLPLFLNSQSNLFQAVVLSKLKKAVVPKMPGKSFVQVSNLGIGKMAKSSGNINKEYKQVDYGSYTMFEPTDGVGDKLTPREMAFKKGFDNPDEFRNSTEFNPDSVVLQIPVKSIQSDIVYSTKHFQGGQLQMPIPVFSYLQNKFGIRIQLTNDQKKQVEKDRFKGDVKGIKLTEDQKVKAKEELTKQGITKIKVGDKEHSIDVYLNQNLLTKISPAQVLVPFNFFKDKVGININDFIETDSQGRKYLKNIHPDLLTLVGARIPNQSHSSQLPIEIVGFLPEWMGDAIVVPDGITKQMGSDFDIDKLYVYKKNYYLSKDGKLKVVKDIEIKEKFVKFVLKDQNLFTVEPKVAVDNKAISKAKLANKYIGFGNKDSSTFLYSQQIPEEFVNTGNYEGTDNIFLSAPGKRGTKEKWQQAIDAIKSEIDIAIESGATIIKDNEAYVNSSDYNIGEKEISKYLKEKGYVYFEQKVDNDVVGVWANDDTKNIKNKRGLKNIENDYFDYMFEVLTNPLMYDKVLKPLDMDDLKVEAAKNVDQYTDYFSPVRQTEEYNSNKDAKTIVGSASLMVPYSVHLQRTENVDLEIPITVTLSDGKALTLDTLSGLGWSSADRNTSDNMIIVQNEAVDHANNKVIDKVNINDETFGVYALLVLLKEKSETLAYQNKRTALSTQEIVKMINSDIVKQYVALLEEYTDGFSEKISKAKIKKLIIERLEQENGIDVADIVEKNEETGVSTANLYIDELGTNPGYTLGAYLYLKDVADELTSYVISSNFDTKGAGTSINEAIEKGKKYEELERYVSEDEPRLIRNIDETVKKTKLKSIAENVLDFANDQLLNVFQMNNIPILFNQMEDLKSGDLSNIERKKIVDHYKSFLLSDQNIGFWDDINEKRKGLLFGESLAHRLQELKSLYPTVRLFNRLQANIGNSSEPSFIKFDTNNRAVDKSIIFNEFKNLTEHEDVRVRDLISDLVSYHYLIGGHTSPESFGEVIPPSILNIEGEKLKLIMTTSESGALNKRFMKQFVQHTGFSAKKDKSKWKGSVIKKKINPIFPPSKYLFKEETVLDPYNNEIVTKTYFELIETMDSEMNTYLRIPSLGKRNVREYNSSTDYVNSFIPDNYLAKDVLPLINGVIPKYSKASAKIKNPISLIGKNAKTTLSKMRSNPTSNYLFEMISKLGLSLPITTNDSESSYKNMKIKINVNQSEAKIVEDINHEVVHALTVNVLEMFRNKTLNIPVQDLNRLNDSIVQIENIRNIVIKQLSVDPQFKSMFESISKKMLIKNDDERLNALTEDMNLKTKNTTDSEKYILAYSLQNIEELLAASFSNEAVQNVLAGIKIDSNKNLWQEVTSFIKNFLVDLSEVLGIAIPSDSALFQIINRSQSIIDQRNSIYAVENRNIFDDIDRANQNLIEQQLMESNRLTYTCKSI